MWAVPFIGPPSMWIQCHETFSGMCTNKQYVKLSPLQYNINMYYSIPSLLLSVGASFLLSPGFGGGIAETQWTMTSANYVYSKVHNTLNWYQH